MTRPAPAGLGETNHEAHKIKAAASELASAWHHQIEKSPLSGRARTAALPPLGTGHAEKITLSLVVFWSGYVGYAFITLNKKSRHVFLPVYLASCHSTGLCITRFATDTNQGNRFCKAAVLLGFFLFIADEAWPFKIAKSSYPGFPSHPTVDL